MARNDARKAAAQTAANEINRFAATVRTHGLNTPATRRQAARTTDALRLADTYGTTNDDIRAAQGR